MSGSTEATTLRKISTALFFACSSVLIVVINKVILTTFKFPSFQVLGIGQMIASILVLLCGKGMNIISFPTLQRDTFQKIFPLPLIYFLNLTFGLGSTKTLNLPMFTVLRRFSILMTMIAEYLILKKVASCRVQTTVYVMIFGSIVAASSDLAFDATGYTMIMINNLMTAVNGVYTKKKLNSNELGKYGILFYNCFYLVVPAICLASYTGDIEKAYQFKDWNNYLFLGQFLMSCFMGFVLNYSIVLCNEANSPLTTTIVGCLKNILVTYVGMLVGGDYVFSWTNFVGLNISIVGSIVYSYIAFTEKQVHKPPPSVSKI